MGTNKKDREKNFTTFKNSDNISNSIFLNDTINNYKNTDFITAQNRESQSHSLNFKKTTSTNYANKSIPQEYKEQERLKKNTGENNLNNVKYSTLCEHMLLKEKTPTDYYKDDVSQEEMNKRLDEALGPKTDFSIWNFENNYDKLNKEQQEMLVHKMQLDFNNLGYRDEKGHALKVDGKFGNNTKWVYEKYKKDNKNNLDDYEKIKYDMDYQVLKDKKEIPMHFASIGKHSNSFYTNKNLHNPLIKLNEKESKYPNFIQNAIVKYKEDWIRSSKRDDFEAMNNAHYAADNARMIGDKLINRKEWGGKDYSDWVKDELKTEIVLHHTDNYKNINEIKQSHISKNFSGVGYHFVISTDGKIYEGRPISYKGSHVDNNNTGKIGIALIGDYHSGILDRNQPTDNQLESMIMLIDVLKTSYDIKSVKTHKDYNDVMKKSTLCPGDTMYDMIKRIY